MTSHAGCVSSTRLPDPARMPLLRRALGLQYFSAGYNIAEGVVAILAGLAASSIALLGFGFDSGMEFAASAIIIARFRAEIRGAGSREDAERRATRLIAVTSFVLAGYVAMESVQSLAAVERPSASPVGIALAIASLAVMPLVARWKRRIATELHSSAALSESRQTVACSILSGLLLLGLLANAAAGWWWADPAAALLMVPFLVNEGRTAWKGRLCCEESGHRHEGGPENGARPRIAYPIAIIAACSVCACLACTDACVHGIPDHCACPHCTVGRPAGGALEIRTARNPASRADTSSRRGPG